MANASVIELFFTMCGLVVVKDSIRTAMKILELYEVPLFEGREDYSDCGTVRSNKLALQQVMH